MRFRFTRVSGGGRNLTFLIAALAAVASWAQSEPVTKDLHIEFSPAQEAMTLEPVHAGSAEPEAGAIAVRAWVDREDATYTLGETVRLNVEVADDAYVWVFDTGTSGRVHRIFPNRFDTDNFVRSGETIAIPNGDAGYAFEVSHPRGVELLTVVATTGDSPLVDHLVEASQPSGGPFLALAGNAQSIAKDISVSLRESGDATAWGKDIVVIRID